MADNTGEGTYTKMLRELHEENPELRGNIAASDAKFIMNNPEVVADHARGIIESTQVKPHESSVWDNFGTPPVLDGAEEKVSEAVKRFNEDQYLQLDAAKVTLGVAADKPWNEESIAAVIQNGKMDEIIRKHGAQFSNAGITTQAVTQAEAQNEKTSIRDVLNGDYLAKRERDAGI